MYPPLFFYLYIILVINHKEEYTMEKKFMKLDEIYENAVQLKEVEDNYSNRTIVAVFKMTTVHIIGVIFTLQMRLI